MNKSLQMSDPLETRASLIHRLPDAADVSAWDEFVQIYAPLIYSVARRKGLQPADADDIVQEVLSAVARSVDDWLQKTTRGRFREWLFTIARNTAVNFLTRRKHKPLGHGGSDAASLLLNVQSQDELSAEFDRQYQREIFRWASLKVKDAVTENTWKAFWQTTMEDRSVTDVAIDLQMTPGSIYIAKSRVMAKLRELVQQFQETDS